MKYGGRKKECKYVAWNTSPIDLGDVSRKIPRDEGVKRRPLYLKASIFCTRVISTVSMERRVHGYEHPATSQMKGIGQKVQQP